MFSQSEDKSAAKASRTVSVGRCASVLTVLMSVTAARSVSACLQVVFGSMVLLMLWLPIRIIKLLFPTFLPYNVMLYR